MSLNIDDIPRDIFYVFGNFSEPGEANKIYKEINDKESLKTMIQSYIQDYNELSKIKIDILLFDEALQNLAKMNRILSREFGHAVLVGLGGDGRRTLTRLASFMQDFDIEEPDTKKDMLQMDWYEYLKDGFRKTGVDEK